MLNTAHPIGLVLLLGLLVYALSRQTVTTPVLAKGRFRLPLVYLAVGLVLSGTAWPSTTAGWAVFAAGLVLSLVVGVARGHGTRIWLDPKQDRVLRRGTPLTIGLYLLLIAAKVVLAVLSAHAGIESGSSVGQILIVVAVSMALQAQVVVRRAIALDDRLLHEAAS